MNKEHVISDEILDIIQAAIDRNRNWMAYNQSLYFIEKTDVEFFKHKEEAEEFVLNNISDYDNYTVICVRYVADVLQQVPYGEELTKQLSDAKNLSIMIEKNYDYLSNQLKYTGFGEDLQAQLKEKMQLQQPEFMLTHQKDFGNDQTVATLHFRKSNESDMYFFNRYTLLLKNEQQAEPLKQTFYINNNQESITLKEAYNLMNGRAIHKELTNKEGENYKAWVQLDFKQTDKNGNYKLHPFNEKYGFDLKKSLEKHVIKEMADPEQQERLMQSLERGNRQAVTIHINGQERKVSIEAAPQFKSLNFYESNGQRIKADKLYESNSQSQSVKQETKKETQSQKDDGDGGPPQQQQKKSRKNRQSIT